MSDEPVSDLRGLINRWRERHSLTTVQTVLFLAMAIGWFSELAYVDHKEERRKDA